MQTSNPIEERPWFLSYSGRDRATVTSIQAQLQKATIPTFFDRRDLTPGVSWFDELDAALLKSTGVLVFLGPSGLGNIQKRELQYALMRQAQAGSSNSEQFRVIPVLLPGYDLKQLPGFAALNTWIEVTDTDRIEELLRALTPNNRGPEQLRAAICPFRGLNAFREEDAPLYFGRSRESTKLLEIVQGQTAASVVGPSGSGKSSLVQAGLMPRLRLQRPPGPTWESITLTPGKRPFYSCAVALSKLWLSPDATVATTVAESETVARQLLDETTHLVSYVHEAMKRLSNAERLLIIIDQFEELFAYSPEKIQRQFADAILTCIHDSACSVLITLRADYYGRLIELSPALCEQFAAGQLNVGPMNRNQLREVVDGPAKRSCVSFEPGLVDRILDDVERQPGSLPLLEFALTELWNSATAGMFTHSAYERIGKVSGAISVRAEQVLGQLSPDQRLRAPSLLTRLVRVSSSGDEGANSRYLLPLSDVDAQGTSVLEQFAKARLLVFSGEEPNVATVEVAHEALIRSWTTLQDWIDADLKFLLWRQQLSVFASEWQRTGHDVGALLTGTFLAEARRWHRIRSQLLTPPELALIRASLRRDRGSRTLRWSAAAAIALALGGSVTYFWWSHTDDFQVHAVLADAPLLEAARSSRSDEDPYWDILQAWVTALVRSGRLDRAQRAADTIGSWYECAHASLVAAKRESGIASGSDKLLTNPSQPQSLDGQFACLANLPSLTVSEKAFIADSAYSFRSTSTESFSRIDNNIEATHALVLFGDSRAAERTHAIVDDVARAGSSSQSQLFAKIVRLLEPAMDAADKMKVLDHMSDGNEYYKRQIELNLQSRTISATNLDNFIQRDSLHSGWQTPLLEANLARTIGVRLSAFLREGTVPDVKVVAITDRLVGTLGNQDSASESKVYLTLPVAISLASIGSSLEAFNMAERALEFAEGLSDEDQKSRALGQVATIYASTGHLAKAKSVADRCRRSLDRLRAYGAILTASVRKK